MCVNYLPNDTFLDYTKLQIFADDKSNVAVMMISVFDRVEDIVAKGESAAFSPFPTMISKGFFVRSLKVGIV